MELKVLELTKLCSSCQTRYLLTKRKFPAKVIKCAEDPAVCFHLSISFH